MADNLFVARVIGDRNDPDFIHLEVGKHDQVSFTLNPDVPDVFYTLVFLKAPEDGSNVAKAWNPFDAR